MRLAGRVSLMPLYGRTRCWGTPTMSDTVPSGGTLAGKFCSVPCQRLRECDARAHRAGLVGTFDHGFTDRGVR